MLICIIRLGGIGRFGGAPVGLGSADPAARLTLHIVVGF
jgi:hypothetical protein